MGSDPEYHATTHYRLDLGLLHLNIYGSPSFGQWAWTVRGPWKNLMSGGCSDTAEEACIEAMKGFMIFVAKKLIINRQPQLEDFRYEENTLRGL